MKKRETSLPILPPPVFLDLGRRKRGNYFPPSLKAGKCSKKLPPPPIIVTFMSKPRLSVNQGFFPDIFILGKKTPNPCLLFLLSEKPMCQAWVEGAVLHELRALTDPPGGRCGRWECKSPVLLSLPGIHISICTSQWTRRVPPLQNHPSPCYLPLSLPSPPLLAFGDQACC